MWSKPVGETGSPPAPLQKGGAGKVPPCFPPSGGETGGDQGGTPDLPNTGVTATSATTFDRTR